MKILAIAVLIVAVSAGTASAERPRGKVLVTKSACQSLKRFRSYSPAFKVQIKRVDVYVNGKALDAIWENSRSVYWAGRATFVQLHALNNSFAWTLMRSVPHCARVRIVYSW